MKRVLKWIGIVIAGFVALLFVIAILVPPA